MPVAEEISVGAAVALVLSGLEGIEGFPHLPNFASPFQMCSMFFFFFSP